MAEKLLVPIYLPSGLRDAVVRLKRLLIPPSSGPQAIDIHGERNIEWTFLSREMPDGPGEALEFGCEQGYLSLLAAQKGFNVVASDLQPQAFLWRHPHVQFQQGDFLALPLARDSFDLLINCSSVEHVGVAGRYGIAEDCENADLRVMQRFSEILKPQGRLLMTVPCGQDALLAPWCRVYGPQRLPMLLSLFTILKDSYWTKNPQNQWVSCERQTALRFVPVNHRTDPHACAYALACFVLGKREPSR